MSQTKAQLLDGSVVSVAFSAGSAATPSLYFAGDLNTGIYSPGADQVAVATNGTGRLFIASDGKVAVNTTPTYWLQVVAPVGAQNIFLAGQTGVSNGYQIDSTGSAITHIWSTAGGERVRLTDAGLVGIGTSAPNYQLHVTTDFAVGASGFNQQLTFGNDTIQSLLLGTGYTALKLNPLGGNVGIGTTSPVALLQVGAGNPGATTAKAVINTNNVSGGGLILSNWTGGATTNGPRIAFDNSGQGGFDIGGGNGNHTFVIRDNTASSDRLTITSAGLVGIGTSSPAAALDIGGTFQSVRTYLSSVTDTYHLYRGTPDSAGFEHARVFSGRDTSVHTYGSYLAFYTEGKSSGTTDTSVERLRIDSSGRVGIGTASPSSTLHVVGSQFLTGGNYFTDTTSGYFFNGSGGFAGGIFGSSSGNIANIVSPQTITLSTASSERARIDSSGRLLVGTSSARTIATQSLAIQNEGTSFGTTGFSTCRNSNDIYGPYIHFGKTRGASVGSNTIVASGDDLGGLIFGGADGTDVDSQAAYIICKVDGTPGANDMPGRLEFWTTSDNAASPTERMRITSQGNVLIGSTVDAIGRFGVAADTNAAPGNRVALFTSTYTGGDSPYEGVGIVKNANDNSTSNVFQVFYINAGVTTCGRINANGAGAAAFGSTSDARLKENIKDIEPQLANICSLRPVEFDYIEAEGGGHQIGFIAQEIENIYPDSISERDDGMKMLTGWSKTEARLVKALQEAVAKIESLEAKVAALEAA